MQSETLRLHEELQSQTGRISRLSDSSVALEEQALHAQQESKRAQQDAQRAHHDKLTLVREVKLEQVRSGLWQGFCPLNVCEKLQAVPLIASELRIVPLACLQSTLPQVIQASNVSAQ